MEHREPIDELFATFVATGDPAALGRVFDATSDGLYRLALHLCGAPATAEDVVQATWLAAIEGAEQFEAGRPVEPWLTGILHNQARMLFRREAVRRRPLEREPEPVVDPSVEAERRELIDALDRGIARLDEPYGPVVRLHLRHGLNANAIGEALGRPAGTVRTQLVRGLDRLRELLPASLAGVAAALALPSRGMAAVRSAVVTKAGGGSAAIAAASWWSLRRLAVAALVLVGGVTLWMLRTPGTAEPTPRRSPVVAAPAVETTADAGAAAEVERVALPRDPVPAAAEHAAVRLRGVVVGVDDVPVADVEVLAFEYEPTRVDGGFTREPLATARTGPDGAFSLAVEAERFHLHAVAEGLMVFESVRGQVDARVEFEGLRIRMRPSVTVRGQLLDPDGQPVAGEEIEISNSYGIGEHVRTRYPGVIRTGAGRAKFESGDDGRFAVACPDGVSHWWTVASRRFARWQESHPARADAEITIRLARGDRVAGRVFLADGRPAAGAEVWLHGYPPREVVADAAGRFEIGGATLEEKTFLNVSHPDAAVFCVQPIPAQHADLSLQLERPRAIGGRVVDGDGLPVAGAVVRAVGSRRIDPPADFGVPHTWEWANDADTVRTDADGRFAYPRLYDGEFELRVAREQLHQGAVSVITAAGREDLLVRLTDEAVRKAVLAGVVVDAETGRAIAGVEVVVAPDGGGMTRRAVSGADGRFALDGFDPGGYSVAASSVGRARTELDTELVLGETEVRVELARAVEVTLRVLDARAEPVEAASVRLRRAGGTPVMFQVAGMRIDRLRTDQNGEVALPESPREVVEVVVDRVGEEQVVQPLDLRVASGTRIDVVLSPVDAAVEVLVAVMVAGADVAEIDTSTPRGVTALRELLQNGGLSAPAGVVRATLTTDDGGRRFARATVSRSTPDGGPAPEDGERRSVLPALPYDVSIEWPGGGSDVSAMRMSMPSFELPGRAVRMRLRVEVDGFDAVERIVDGAALVGARPQPLFVLLRPR